jgi:hypothetical protein
MQPEHAPSDPLDAAALLRWCRASRVLVPHPIHLVNPSTAYGASMLQSTLEWLAYPKTWRPIGPRDTAQRQLFQRAVRRQRPLGMPATPDALITVATEVTRSALTFANYDPVVDDGIRWGMRLHAQRLRQRARTIREIAA